MKTMLKRSLLAMILLTGTLYGYAQPKTVTFGVKAGLDISQFSGDLNRGDLDNVNSKIGYNAGVTLDFAFSQSIYLMTGMELNSKGLTEHRKGKEININATYVNMPLQLGYKLQIEDDLPTFVCRLGPYVGYGIGGKTKLKELNLESNTFSEGGLKKLDVGIGVAVGAEIGHIAVDLGYNLGLVDISDQKENIKARNYFASVGYKF